MKNKACIIHLHFQEEESEWPAYFHANLLSCEYNPDFDWLIFTNKLAKTSLPPNVKIINISLDDFSNLIKQKINVSPDWNHPLERSPSKHDIARRTHVKVCDFRQAFGLIFEDYLKEYTFWGHCDIDVIYGDLNKNITDHALDNCEILAPLHPCGHFCLYRNNYKINNAFLNHEGSVIQRIVRRFSVSRLGLKLKAHEPIIYENIIKSKTTRDLLSTPVHFSLPESTSKANLTRPSEFNNQGVRFLIPLDVAMTKYKNFRPLHKFVAANAPFKWNAGELFTANGVEVDILHHQCKKFLSSTSNVDFSYGDDVGCFYMTQEKIYRG